MSNLAWFMCFGSSTLVCRINDVDVYMWFSLHAIIHNVSFLLSHSRWMSFQAKIGAQLAHYTQRQHSGAIFVPLTLWHKHLSCLLRSPGLEEELIKAKLQGQRLTEHDEFDCVPVVLPAVLDLADVLSRVCEREVTDHEWSVTLQIVAR